MSIVLMIYFVMATKCQKRMYFGVHSARIGICRFDKHNMKNDTRAIYLFEVFICGNIIFVARCFAPLGRVFMCVVCVFVCASADFRSSPNRTTSLLSPFAPDNLFPFFCTPFVREY